MPLNNHPPRLEMSQVLAFQVVLLLTTALHVQSEEEICTKGAVHSCADCIVSGPHCSWCKLEDFTKPGIPDSARCDTIANLRKNNCTGKYVISPVNSQQIDKQKPLSGDLGSADPVQVYPQEVSLKLRPKLTHKIKLTFKRAEGYPVDLYYLMDLSYSMKDDLERLKTLGGQLVTALQQITGGANKARIGFGSFVDKTVLPFTNTNKEKLKNPCPTGEDRCQPPFGYKHVLRLTNDHNLFNKMVGEQSISGNLDTPEGGLDAIMQAAMCEGDIGWGNATRLLVLATDAGFHMAGDGKLAAILDPNDEACHLRGNIYSKSNLLDYPSVGQIARALESKNIQPIFAVTSGVKDVYMELKKMIPKSEVGVLSENSDNVVSLIKDAYNTLSSRVIVTHDTLPDNVKVQYTSDCPGGQEPRDEGVCDNVGLLQEVNFYVEVRVTECLKNDISFFVGPRGFNEKMKVTISTRCDCECDDPMGTSHEHCNKAGAIKCGICKCNKGFTGQKCECKQGDRDDATLLQQCRRDNGTVCENRGDCVCGQCVCHRSTSQKQYYGRFCECVDEGCQTHDNKECSGNGECKCGKCQCHSGYEGSACQCKMSTEACKTGNTVCNGRGSCECNVCKCLRGYQKPFCLTCPACTAPCQQSTSCIECLGFNEGPLEKNCKEACKAFTYNMTEKFAIDPDAKVCKVKDSKNCWLDFTIKERQGFDQYHVQILNDRKCPEPPNIIAIVGGSVAGVALIGLLILLIIKALLYARDLKEWKRFENEKKKSKWSNADNPLFKGATTTVANPTFSGE